MGLTSARRTEADDNRGRLVAAPNDLVSGLEASSPVIEPGSCSAPE
jgi:hypothetical protein